MKLSFKTILPIILISALLILLNGCTGTVPDESPGYTPGTITGIIAAPCCSTSDDPVTETCCVSPEYWCYYCQGNWNLQDGIEVVLTYGEDEVATTTTNDKGEFTFTNVDPGKNYVITAYCPDFADNRPLVKDVALQLIEGGSFDTKITDLVSTSLGLVVDFLVQYTEWGPEDISLDAVLADRPTFPNFPKFKALIYEVRRVVENCELNLLTDDDVLYATCRAAEEISGLDIGCGAGFTPPPGPPPTPPGECDGNLLPDITDVTQDGTSIFNIDPALVADIHLIAGTPYVFCVTAADNDNILPQDLIYSLTIGDDTFYLVNNCLTITPEAEDVDSNPHEVFVNVYDGCDTKTWGPITVIVDCCPFGEPGLTINIEEPVANEMGIEMSKNGEPEPIPDITICMEDCAIINSVTIHYGGTYPLPDLVITPSYIDKGLTWVVDSGISFDPTTGEICLAGGVVGTDYHVEFTYTDPCGQTATGTATVQFKLCCPPLDPNLTIAIDDANPCSDSLATITSVTANWGGADHAFIPSYAGITGLSWVVRAADVGKIDFDETSGEVTLTSGVVGTDYHVDFTYTDLCGVEATGTATVNFKDCCENNDPPYFTSTPVTKAVGGASYFYDANATDPEGHILTYAEGTNWPTWLSLDTTSGEISGTAPCCARSRCGDCPPTPPTCYFNVDIEVSDECSTETQSFTIEVKNNPPSFTSIPVKIVCPFGTTYTYNITATDTDSDELTFELVEYPENMTISPTGLKSARISWTANCSDDQKCTICTYSIKMKVSDECSDVSQSYPLLVKEYCW